MTNTLYAFPPITQCRNCGAELGFTYPPGSRPYCSNNCYFAFHKKETTMTTLETRDTEAPGPIEVNGHAEGAGTRKRKAAPLVGNTEARADAFLAKEEDTTKERAAIVGALKEEILRLNQKLVLLAGGPVDTIKIPESVKPGKAFSIKHVKAAKPREYRNGTRTPRADSVPSKVHALLRVNGSMSASDIAKALELSPARVHSALQQLKKRGEVTSKGKGKERVWSSK